MGNQGSAEHKALEHTPLFKEYKKSRRKQKGALDFTDEEVCWLLYYFIETTKKLSGVEDEHLSHLREKRKPLYLRFSFLAELNISQTDASNIVVFGKKLQLYPLIARRIWSVLDPKRTKQSSFLDWINILRVISFGSFNDKMALAFRLFQKEKVKRQDVNELFSEIGEFLSEVGMGITDAIEFLIIKSFAWDEIFSKQETLDKHDWIRCAEVYSALIAPFDVLNVILGQDIRRMDENLNTPRIFGQSINKIAFGYASDFTGSRVLVPELLLTACKFFRDAQLEELPNLFDAKVALTMACDMRKDLDSGLPLKRILLTCHKEMNRLHYYAVGTLLKDFCDQLPRPIFGFQACGRLIEVYKQDLPEHKTIALYVAIFTEMEYLSKIFFKILISLFSRFSISERKKISKLFSRSRIFRYSEDGNSKAKHNWTCLEDILEFMIANSNKFIAITMGETVNPWERIIELENQVKQLKAELNTRNIPSYLPAGSAKAGSPATIRQWLYDSADSGNKKSPSPSAIRNTSSREQEPDLKTLKRLNSTKKRSTRHSKPSISDMKFGDI